MRELLSSWEPKETERLKQARKAKMRAELEKRLTTTAEREALARELIRDDLVELAKVRTSCLAVKDKYSVALRRGELLHAMMPFTHVTRVTCMTRFTILRCAPPFTLQGDVERLRTKLEGLAEEAEKEGAQTAA